MNNSIRIRKRMLSVLLTVIMLLTLMPALPLTVSAVDAFVGITDAMTISGIQAEIQDAIDSAPQGSTITIAGSKTNESGTISLNIPLEDTVVFNAISKELSFNIDGGGTFEVSSGGRIEVTGKTAIEVNIGNVTVSGGYVSVTQQDSIFELYRRAIHVKAGIVKVTGGKVIAKGRAGAIEVKTGNVTIYNGEVSVQRFGVNDWEYRKTIYVEYGNVTVWGGKISAARNSAAIHLENGNVRVDSGEVSSIGETVNGITTGNTYAIRIDGRGTIIITGGKVIAEGASSINTAVIFDYGIAAYYEGTVFGDFEIWIPDYGVVLEVDSLNIPDSYHGTANGLTRIEGGSLSDVSWDTSGSRIDIHFIYDGYDFWAPWTWRDAPPKPPEDLPVKLKETGEQFKTLHEGLEAANTAGLSTFTLEVTGGVTETGDVVISTENVTIVGAGGAHTVTFASAEKPGTSLKFTVEGGGSLTLGDGTTTNELTILRAVGVINGSIHAKDGISLISTGNAALTMNGTDVNGSITGGRFEATGSSSVALDVKGGATLTEISGGTFIGNIDAAHFSDAGTRVELISGGSFFQVVPDIALHGHALFVQNDAEIGTISGGYFEAADNGAMVVIRGGFVGEISGGIFKSLRKTHNVVDPGGSNVNAVIWIETRPSEKFKGSGVGTISGGSFSGGHFGVLVIGDHTDTDGYYTSRIGSITGGVFEGNVAVQVDLGSSVGEISGGKIIGGQGILNAGLIKKISGQADIYGSTSYGIFNYVGGKIEEISGGTIVSGEDNGIANSGTINLISGGTIIGHLSAIHNDGFNKGRINTISNGVFWGKNRTAIVLAYSVVLEPGLKETIGFGRYWGRDGVIFNNESLVVYPINAELGAKYFMSTETMPVDGIAEVEFKFLRLPYTVIFEPGTHGTFDAVTHTGLEPGTSTPEPPEPTGEDGWTFVGWAPEISETVTGDAVYVAQWEHDDPVTPVATFTVVFDPGEHGVFAVATHTGLEYGTATPDAPEPIGEDGWTFSGWEPIISDIVTDDVTYVAQWIEDTPPQPALYVVKVIDSYAEITGAGSYQEGAIVAIDAGTRANYTFAGWIVNEGGIAIGNPYSATVTFEMPANDVTVTANWRRNEGGGPPPEPQPKTATLNVSKALLDSDGKYTDTGAEFVIVLYEKADQGGWVKTGEYSVLANSRAIAITGLLGEKTYQLVEKTNSWYRALGYEIAFDSMLIGSSAGESVALTIPALSQNITINVLVRNEKVGDPGGPPGGGGSVIEPPLFELPEDDIPLRPFISEHVAYVIGYQDGTVRPRQNITRAEVATVFFRLLTDEVRMFNWTQQNPFLDVAAGNWYNNAVSVMSNMSVVKGYPDGSFKPDGAITRAELAAIAARFARSMGMKPVNVPNFSDVAGHWAEDDVNFSAAVGWVAGYPDGTYRPDQPITRAEFMTLVNRMLERAPEDPDDLLDKDMVVWPDNADRNAWFYLAVQEATNSHLPEYKDKTVPGLRFDYEYWLELIENRDWSLLERS